MVIRLVLTGLKRTMLVHLLGLFGDSGRKDGVIYCVCVCVCVCVCEAPLDDWPNGVSVDVFFTNGDYGFSSMVI